MDKISNTLSICEHCYRHVPAVRFERDNSIWLGKTCKEHGYLEHLVEPDAKFYLDYVYPKRPLEAYFIEVTNRCNLTCPHCYQIPDNTSKDLPIDYILQTIKSWPDDGYTISLAGAEPTVRKDLPELITAIQALPGKPRRIVVLTNAVRLADMDYAKTFVGIDNLFWTVGLNHPDYQGHKVRAKQIKGIENCVELGFKIKNISYTLESLDQLEYCLEETQKFYPIYCKQFRIRVGVDIGRNPDGPTVYLSQLVNAAKEVAVKHNWSYETNMEDGIRAHYPVYINGVYVKLIQWPDATTLDLEEMQTETWADLIPGKPVSPLIHQVMIRDRLTNNGIQLLDTIPSQYRRIND